MLSALDPERGLTIDAKASPNKVFRIAKLKFTSFAAKLHFIRKLFHPYLFGFFLSGLSQKNESNESTPCTWYSRGIDLGFCVFGVDPSGLNDYKANYSGHNEYVEQHMNYGT